MPENLEFTVRAQEGYSLDPVFEDEDLTPALVSYSNLVPTQNFVNIKDEKIETVEDLTRFYLDPDNNSLEDVEEYDYHRESYRRLIMETIINKNPDIFASAKLCYIKTKTKFNSLWLKEMENQLLM